MYQEWQLLLLGPRLLSRRITSNGFLELPFSFQVSADDLYGDPFWRNDLFMKSRLMKLCLAIKYMSVHALGHGLETT